MTYAQRAGSRGASAATRGSSNSQALISRGGGSSGSSQRTSSTPILTVRCVPVQQAPAPAASAAATATPVLVPPPRVGSPQQRRLAERHSAESATEMKRQSQWEQFASHREEVRSRIDGLVEATEQQQIDHAGTQEQLSQLEEGLGLCLEGMAEVRAQSSSCDKRVATLDGLVRDSVDELRSSIGRIEEQCERKNDAAIAAVRHGDQTVADELLLKMAELNEKLGSNMQALEDELTTTIESATRRNNEDQLSVGSKCTACPSDALELLHDGIRGLQSGLEETGRAQEALSSKLVEEVESLRTEFKKADAGRDIDGEMLEIGATQSRLETKMESVQEELRTALASAVAEAVAQEPRELIDGLEEVRRGMDEFKHANHEVRTQLRDTQKSQDTMDDAVQCLREEMQAALPPLNDLYTDLRAEIKAEITEMRLANNRLSTGMNKLVTDMQVDLRDVLSNGDANTGAKISPPVEEGIIDEIRVAIGDAFNGLQETHDAHDALTKVVDEAVCGLHDKLHKVAPACARNEKLIADLQAQVMEMRKTQDEVLSSNHQHTQLHDMMKAEFKDVRSAHDGLRHDLDIALCSMRREQEDTAAAAGLQDNSALDTCIVDELRLGIKDALSDNRQLRAGLQETCTQHTDLASTVDELARRMEKQIRIIEPACASLGDLQDEWRISLDETRTAIDGLRAYVDETVRTMDEQSDGVDIEALRRGLSDTQGVTADLQLRFAELEAISLDEAVLNLQKQLESNRKEHRNELRSSLKEVQTTQDNLEASIAKAEHKIVTLTESLGGSASAQLAKLQMEFEQWLEAKDSTVGITTTTPGGLILPRIMERLEERLEEQLQVVTRDISRVEKKCQPQASNNADVSRLERRHEAVSQEIAGLRRSFNDLMGDVQKAQGAADAAFAEAARHPDWSASLESLRQEWQAHRKMVKEEVQELQSQPEEHLGQHEFDKLEAKIEGVMAQCSSLGVELRADIGSCTKEFEQLDAHLAHHREEVLRESEQAAERISAGRLEAFGNELEQVRIEVSSVVEQCEALGLETRRQCRSWVDGALRRLEDLALRTRERFGALAAERREGQDNGNGQLAASPGTMLDGRLAPLNLQLEKLTAGCQGADSAVVDLNERLSDELSQINAAIGVAAAEQRAQASRVAEEMFELRSEMYRNPMEKWRTSVMAEEQMQKKAAPQKECCFQPRFPSQVDSALVVGHAFSNKSAACMAVPVAPPPVSARPKVVVVTQEQGNDLAGSPLRPPPPAKHIAKMPPSPFALGSPLAAVSPHGQAVGAPALAAATSSVEEPHPSKAARFVPAEAHSPAAPRALFSPGGIGQSPQASPHAAG